MHATRYQYAFALTPESLHDHARALALVDALIGLSEVAGNHSRNLYDFAPDTVIFRWTEDPAPRILYPFLLDSTGDLRVPELLRRIDAGDVDAGELIAGGSLAGTEDGNALVASGATMHAGVKAAAAEVKQRLNGQAGT